jgi:hypothetical protein
VGRKNTMVAASALLKIKTAQPRNEAQLNCVSLRSEIDDEVTRELSRKVEMNVPSGTPLTTPKSPAEGSASQESYGRPPRRP